MTVYSTIGADEMEYEVDSIRVHHSLELVTVHREYRRSYFAVPDTHCFEEPFSVAVYYFPGYFHRGHDYLHGWLYLISVLGLLCGWKKGKCSSTRSTTNGSVPGHIFKNTFL